MEIATAPSVVDLEKQYLLQNYARYPVVLHRGKGCYVYDTAGKRYLDLLAGIGVNALGHAHPRITKVIREQAGRLIHSSNLYYHEYTGPLAERISLASQLPRIFFCNSGTEANEAALKMAKAHGRKISPEKFEIVSLENSFHGRTIGALSVTGQESYRRDFEPLVPGVRFVPRNDLAALEQAVGDRTAGIILELVQGEGGIYPLTAAFVRKARELADRYDAILIFDEIQCGVGRTGKFFAYEWIGVQPDIMCVAKGIGGGFPLGACLATAEAAKGMTVGTHGSTYGGNPLGMAVGNAAIDLVLSPGFLEHVQAIGNYLRQQLAGLIAEHPSVFEELRGQGLMLGLKMRVPNTEFVAGARQHGLLIVGAGENVVRLLPPLIVDEEQVREAIALLSAAATDFETEKKTVAA